MFITIDGPDGVGKTTLAKELVSFLNRELGHAVYTAEPTDSDFGKKIRRILRDSPPDEIGSLTEYFIEDRHAHVLDIEQKIAEGCIVVCDRYRYSTVVYQHMQGESIEHLIKLNIDFPRPDYSFILNVENVDVLLSRIASRHQDEDLFETMFSLKKAISLYRNMTQYFPQDHIIFLDGSRTLQETLLEVREALCIGIK